MEGTEPVRGLRRSGRGHPELAEDPVADVKVELALEAQIGRWVRKGIRVRGRQGRRDAAGIALERLRSAEVRGGTSDLGHPNGICGIARRRRIDGKKGEAGEEAPCEGRRHVAPRISSTSRPVDPCSGHVHSKHDGPRRHPSGPFAALPNRDGPDPRGEGPALHSRYRRRRSYSYSNTASGLSRLSEPSTSIASRPRAATTCSMVRVCSVSRSIAACTTALPSAFPSPSIWS